MFCSRCGEKNSDNFTYCASCASSLDTEISDFSVSSSEINFCSKCGEKRIDAYCTSCGYSMTNFKIATTAPIFSSMPGGLSLSGNTAENSEQTIKKITILLLGMVGLFYTNPITLFTNDWVFNVSLLQMILTAGLIAMFFVANKFSENNRHDTATFVYAGGFIVAFIMNIVLYNMQIVYSYNNSYPLIVIANIMLLAFILLKAYLAFEAGFPELKQRFLKSFTLPEKLIQINEKCFDATLSSLVVAVLLKEPFIISAMFRNYYFIGFIQELLIPVALILVAIARYFYSQNKIKASQGLLIGVICSFAILLLTSLIWHTHYSIYCVIALAAAGYVMATSYKRTKSELDSKAESISPDVVQPQRPQADDAHGHAYSRFDGSVGGAVGIRILTFLLAFVLPLILIVSPCAAILDSYGFVAAIIAFVILLIIVYPICASFAACLLWRWETGHTIVRGERLVFTGTVMGTFGTLLKIFILSVITFGLYALFCANINALNKYRYLHTKVLGRENETSAFDGICFSIFGYNLLFSILTFFVSCGSIHFIYSMIRRNAWGFVSSYTSGGPVSSAIQFISDPESLFDGLYGLSIDSLSMVIFGSAFIFIIAVAIQYLKRYVLLRWEINNVIINNSMWRFQNDFAGFTGVLLINSILTIFTLGIYSILGIDYYMVTRYKVRHIL